MKILKRIWFVISLLSVTAFLIAAFPSLIIIGIFLFIFTGRDLIGGSIEKYMDILEYLEETLLTPKTWKHSKRS